MNCEICETRFDHDEHKPYCIIPCTHSYCITCLNRLIRKKCPKCDTLIQSKNPNWSLIGLIGIDSIPSSKNDSHDLKSKTFETPLRTPIIDEASYYFNRGLEMYYQKEYKQSVEAYENAIKFSNANVLAYNNKGISLKELKDYHGAILSFNKAIEIEPRFEKAYNNLGRVYFDIRNYGKAIECFDKAIEINPNYVLAHHNKGLAYHALKNYAQAITAFNRAIMLDDLYYESYIAKGYAIKQLKHEKELTNAIKSVSQSMYK